MRSSRRDNGYWGSKVSLPFLRVEHSPVVVKGSVRIIARRRVYELPATTSSTTYDFSSFVNGIIRWKSS